MPKISIIIPVYNTEKYLSECIESIRKQTIHDFECILVDDGSTDTSPQICDKYAAQDSRIKVIHKANGRAASARNAGLRIACGDFIGFVDADDWIAPDMYEKMLATNADVCLCDYVRFDGSREFPFSQPNIRSGFYNQEQIHREVFPHLVMDGLEYPITISNCVLTIRRSLLSNYHLFYREDILISEDAPFGSEVLYHASSFAYLKSKYLYHYRITEGSASKSHKSWWWDSFLKINEEIENYFSSCKTYDFTQQIKSNMFYLARAEISYIQDDTSLPRREQNHKIKAVMTHPCVARMMQGYKCTGASLALKMIYWSIRYRSVSLLRLVNILSKIRHCIK